MQFDEKEVGMRFAPCVRVCALLYLGCPSYL